MVVFCLGLYIKRIANFNQSFYCQYLGLKSIFKVVNEYWQKKTFSQNRNSFLEQTQPKLLRLFFNFLENKTLRRFATRILALKDPINRNNKLYLMYKLIPSQQHTHRVSDEPLWLRTRALLVILPLLVILTPVLSRLI